ITFEGHGELIRSISYFPDGERMISGSEDKTVRQWDLKAGKEIERARSVCEGDVWAVAVSGDGRWVVAAGGDWNSTELKACEVETGIVKTFEGHSNQITCVDISADSTLLATGAKDFTVRVWNLESWTLAKSWPTVLGDSFEGHTGTIESLALSFDCTLLASASSDDTVKLW
ncbi:WD40-repeat-containing domain protein, partial [Suillus tomentosus]